MKDTTHNLYVRLPLGLLQLVFLFVLSHHVNVSAIVLARDLTLLGLLVLPLVVLALPRARLGSARSIFLMVAGNAGVLVHPVIEAKAIEPWLALASVVVTLIASFSPSLAQLLGLGGILCDGEKGTFYPVFDDAARLRSSRPA